MLILSLVGTDAQIGYYSAGLKMVEPWTMVPQTVMPNVLPVLSRSYHDRDGRAHRIQRLTVKYLQAIAIPVSVLLVVLADPLITTLFGQAFAEAVPIVQILAATVALQFYVAVLWRVLVARGDETVMLRAQAITVVPRVAGGLLLVLWLSSAGAALAALGALTLHAALLAHGVRADGSRLGVVALTWRFLAAAVLAGLLLLPLLAADLPLVVLLAAAAALYAAGVVLLRALDRDDLELVRRVLPSRPPRSRGALS
jgi:O-antigen/teichoic acid export membrane protein